MKRDPQLPSLVRLALVECKLRRNIDIGRIVNTLDAAAFWREQWESNPSLGMTTRVSKLSTRNDAKLKKVRKALSTVLDALNGTDQASLLVQRLAGIVARDKFEAQLTDLLDELKPDVLDGTRPSEREKALIEDIRRMDLTELRQIFEQIAEQLYGAEERKGALDFVDYSMERFQRAMETGRIETDPDLTPFDQARRQDYDRVAVLYIGQAIVATDGLPSLSAKKNARTSRLGVMLAKLVGIETTPEAVATAWRRAGITGDAGRKAELES